jgi:hypothetical protein
MIPDNITKEHLEKAIEEIDRDGVRKGRHSSTYDLLHNGKSYPPKLVISIANKYANGSELNPNDFGGGKDTKAFELLQKEGFSIKEKPKTANPIYTLLMKAKADVEKAGFNYKSLRQNSRYVWVEDSNNTIGRKPAHYEFISRRNTLYLELHFEETKSKSLFQQLIKNLPEQLEWFEWNGSQSIRHKNSYSLYDQDIDSKIVNDLIEFDSLIGNKVRSILMNVGQRQKDNRESFTIWLTKKYGEDSGTSSSYIKAIDILSQILSKELFKTTEDNYLESLYKDLIKEQRNQEGKYYHSDAPSYGSHGFYSASIKSYREFLKAINQLETIVKDDDMNFPLNTILYGPPGTGKTYNTILRAAQIIENRIIDSYDEALEVFKDNLHDKIEFITFHQNYSYEDFIQGLRPDTENDNQLTFERKDGVFKEIADKALKNLKESEKPQLSKRPFEEVFNEFINPLVEGEIEEIEVKMKKVSYFITAISNKSIDFRKASGGTAHTLSIGTLKKMYLAESVLKIQGLASYYTPLLTELLKLGKDSSGKKEQIKRQDYVIIIDEINRANISRVFGELITLIEPDKRSHGAIPLEARLPSGDPFIVPSNLFIIGTMNTADKSIALLDIALRRRFEFESMYPKYEIEGQEIFDVEILEKINKQIIKSKGHDFQIGHAYFMGDNKDLVQRMNKKVIPLLLEYYMNDEKEVKGILNSAGLVIEENSWPLKISGKND